MKAMSWRKGCDVRYSDKELYGPRSGIYRCAETVRTDGYIMATLPPLIWRSRSQWHEMKMEKAVQMLWWLCIMLNVECRMSNVECWMSNVECWMLNVECWMLNVECWMLNVECRKTIMSNSHWLKSSKKMCKKMGRKSSWIVFDGQGLTMLFVN
jgi:hypothetical protein